MTGKYLPILLAEENKNKTFQTDHKAEISSSTLPSPNVYLY